MRLSHIGLFTTQVLILSPTIRLASTKRDTLQIFKESGILKFNNDIIWQDLLKIIIYSNNAYFSVYK